uniref:Uncharacterized protein n=1 Tax=Junco hyemalis TaxID=40217 RepID=A0A8C5JNU7_JUNHY
MTGIPLQGQDSLSKDPLSNDRNSTPGTGFPLQGSLLQVSPLQGQNPLSRGWIPSAGLPSPGTGTPLQGQDSHSRDRIPSSGQDHLSRNGIPSPGFPSPETESPLQGMDPLSRDGIPFPRAGFPLQGSPLQGQHLLFRHSIPSPGNSCPRAARAAPSAPHTGWEGWECSGAGIQQSTWSCCCSGPPAAPKAPPESRFGLRSAQNPSPAQRVELGWAPQGYSPAGSGWRPCSLPSPAGSAAWRNCAPSSAAGLRNFSPLLAVGLRNCAPSPAARWRNSAGWRNCAPSSAAGWRNCAPSSAAGWRNCAPPSAARWRNCAPSPAAGLRNCAPPSAAGWRNFSPSPAAGWRICAPPSAAVSRRRHSWAFKNHPRSFPENNWEWGNLCTASSCWWLPPQTQPKGKTPLQAPSQLWAAQGNGSQLNSSSGQPRGMDPSSGYPRGWILAQGMDPSPWVGSQLNSALGIPGDGSQPRGKGVKGRSEFPPISTSKLGTPAAARAVCCPQHSFPQLSSHLQTSSSSFAGESPTTFHPCKSRVPRAPQPTQQEKHRKQSTSRNRNDN